MRRFLIFALLMVAIPVIADSWPMDFPRPNMSNPEPHIGPVPVPVMEQMFWAQVPVPPEIDAEVSAPEGVKLLDRTKPGPNRKISRFYFRADRGITDGEIVITPAQGQAFTLPLTVLTYHQDIENQLKRIPEIVPGARKGNRSFFTDDIIEIAKANAEAYPGLIDQLKSYSHFDEMTDAELWKYYPSWSVPRICYSNWPCPVHGEDIYKTSGFYPWGRDSSKPYKCICPISGDTFPSNDWANDDFTSGDYPDDGWGYDPGTGDPDDYAGWVAHYNHHVTWQSGGALLRLAKRYMLLGDRDAAHRAAILLTRLAYVYPGLNYRWQQVHAGEYMGRPGRALTDGNWERNNLLCPVLKTYDAIFEYIDTDDELVAFLHEKDPSINSPDDVKALLDTCLIQVFGWDYIRRELTGGNQGAREQDFAEMILCADMGEVSDRWLEELFTHAYNSSTNRGGVDDAMFVNTLSREGHTLVSGSGYALGYLRSKSDMATTLSRIKSDKWASRLNLYDETAYPKLHAEYDLWSDMIVAGQFVPQYGDSGSPRTVKAAAGIPANHYLEYARAFRHWPDDRIARALYRAGQKMPELFEHDVWPDAAARAERSGPEPPLQSRVMDGCGMAILESRPDANEIDDRAGVTFRYGYALGHHHSDNLNVELFAHGESLSPELGYPTWAHPLGATAATAHHNTGMIDRALQYTGGIGKGALEIFAGAPEASFADISAEPAGFSNRFYRRGICLADAPGGNVYLFDVLRIAGGTQRTWCFHGPAWDDFASSLTFSPAGEEFGLANASRNLKDNVRDPQAAATDADVWADWKFEGKDLHIRMHLIGQPDREYTIARYAKTDSPPIRFLFAEDDAEDAASEFVSIWQPYETAPFIQSIERIPVDSSDGEFNPVAVRVTLDGGQVDTLIYSQNPEAELSVAGLTFQGSFGYWSELNGRPRCLHLVNGTKLHRNGIGVLATQPAFTATATAANLQARTVTLDSPLPPGEILAGQMIYFRNESHRSAYHIKNVSASGDVVTLDLDALLYRSRVDGVSDAPDTLLVELPFTIPASGGTEPHSYYDGAFVTGEDFKAAYRVVSVQSPGSGEASGRLQLDRPVDLADFPDVDGDGRGMVYIYDFGPGDEVSVCNSVYADFASGAVSGLPGAKITNP